MLVVGCVGVASMREGGVTAYVILRDPWKVLNVFCHDKVVNQNEATRIM